MQLKLSKIIKRKFLKNFADFFNQEKALIYGISPNHRMTNNCYYLGLLEKTTSEYKDAKPTDVFMKLKENVKVILKIQTLMLI